MAVRLRKQILLLITLLFVLSFCLVEASAQTRRKKRSRQAGSGQASHNKSTYCSAG